MSKKTIEEWTQEFDKAEGDAFDKSLELLRQYCGLIPAIGANTAAGIFGRAITWRWNSHNSEAVQKAIKFYYPQIVPTSDHSARPERTVASLLELVRIHLSLAKLEPKDDGDLCKILQVIIKKTGTYMSPLSKTTRDYYPDVDIDNDELIKNTW